MQHSEVFQNFGGVFP